MEILSVCCGQKEKGVYETEMEQNKVHTISDLETWSKDNMADKVFKIITAMALPRDSLVESFPSEKEVSDKLDSVY